MKLVMGRKRVVLLPLASLFAVEPAPRGALEKRLAEVSASEDDRKAAVAKGKELTGFCASCHGPDGNSTKPDVPHLASQNTAYLLDQMERFADGRRHDYIMSPLAKRFSAEEKIALVLYYSVQTRRYEYKRPDDPAMVVRGRGKQGYSYIAGLPEKYVSSTLTHFRE